MMKQCIFKKDVAAVGAKNRLLGSFQPIETSWFKRVFTARAGEKVVLKVFAASRYCLYLNGEMIHNGPQKGDRNASYMDTLDLTASVKEGENVISLKVTAYPPFDAYVSDHDGETNRGPYGVMGVSCGPVIVVACEEGGIDLSTASGEWYVLNDESVKYELGKMYFVMGGNEVIDFSKMSLHTMDADLKEFESVETRWVYRAGTPIVLTPFMLYERTLPMLLLDEERGFIREMSVTEEGCEKISLLDGAKTLAANGRYAVDLDAGELRTAYLKLKMSGGRGAKIEIRCCEGYSNMCYDGPYPHPVKGRRDDCEHYGFIGLSDWLYPDGEEREFSGFWFRTFRFVRLVIETKDEPITLFAPTYRVTHYPLDVRAKIAPDQEWVRKLWDMCVRTLKLCMHETHEDCPYYEQLQYAFDTRLQMLFTYALSADTRMAERVIYDFHASLLPDGLLRSRYPTTEEQVIPCFSLQWIGMLKDHYMQTGDDSLIRRYRTTMESILEWFGRKKGDSGLCERLGYWEFVDWPGEWGPGFGQPTAAWQEGISAVENMLYALFLGTAAELLDIIGRTQDAGFLRDERAGILNALQEKCWNAEKGLYREGPKTEEYTQHAQFYAVLNDMVTGDEAKALMKRAVDDKTLVQATFPLQYDLFSALDRVGLYEETEKLWPMWQCLLDDDLSTIPEVPGNQTRSDCHAWGAELLYEYPNRILGVYPEKPGYECVGIRPRAMFLGQAAGEVPTPKGMVKVSWTMKDGAFAMTAEWPKGVSAKITLPCGETIISDMGSYTIG